MKCRNKFFIVIIEINLIAKQAKVKDINSHVQIHRLLRNLRKKGG